MSDVTLTKKELEQLVRMIAATEARREREKARRAVAAQERKTREERETRQRRIEACAAMREYIYMKGVSEQ